MNINLVKSAIVEHQTIRHAPNNLFEIVYDNGLSTKKVSYYPIRSEVSRIPIRFNVQQTVSTNCILIVKFFELSLYSWKTEGP